MQQFYQEFKQRTKHLQIGLLNGWITLEEYRKERLEMARTFKLWLPV